MRIILWAVYLTTTLFLSACTMGETVYAPVLDASPIERLPSAGTYRVRADDTLYSIAWRYGFDYRYLARINGIEKPYHIQPNQLIYLKDKKVRKQVVRHTFNAPIIKKSRSSIPAPAPKAPIEREPMGSVRSWSWPAQGQIINTYSASNKGINISGYSGAPIYATASGKVVYSGNGLRAYGNLIIIKHNSDYLSAYAYNRAVLVKEGEWVKAGQEIAKMGATSAGQTMLHFEIRYGGKPMNPLNYLTKR